MILVGKGACQEVPFPRVEVMGRFYSSVQDQGRDSALLGLVQLLQRDPETCFSLYGVVDGRQQQSLQGLVR